MSYEVDLSNKAYSALGDLPKHIQKIAGKLIFSISENPFLPGHKKMRDYNPACYRFRFGKNYRLIFRVDEPNKVVEIIAIGHRKDIYR